MSIYTAVLFIILGLFSSKVDADITQEPLIIGVNDYAPYKGDGLPGSGLTVSIAHEALRRAGYNVVLSYAPWKRIDAGMKRGIYHIVPGLWFKEYRTEFLAYGDKLAVTRVVIICHKDNKRDVYTLKDLTGLVVAAPRGYAFPTEFTESKKFEIIRTNNLEQSLKLTIFKRVDCTIGDELVARYTANLKFAEKSDMLTYSNTPLWVENFYLVVSKIHPDHKEIVRHFNASLKKMHEDGSYKKIVNMHVLGIKSLSDDVNYIKAIKKHGFD